MGGTKLASTLDRGSTIYDSLAGTYLGQRLLSVARGSPVFSRTLHYVIKDDRSSWTRVIRSARHWTSRRWTLYGANEREGQTL